MNTIIINCYNEGEISGKSDVGGIVGTSPNKVNNCYNKGNVSGKFVGGITGNMHNRKNNKFIQYGRNTRNLCRRNCKFGK